MSTPMHTPVEHGPVGQDPDAAGPGGRLRWPAERLYFAHLQAPGFRGRGAVPAGLLPELAEELPVPLEEMHAVCAPCVNGGGVVVCAALREDLLGLGPSGALSLTPAGLPGGVEGPADLGELELLTGPFEPAPLRRARRLRHGLAMAGVLALAGLAAAGNLRRAQHAEAAADAAAGARAALLAGVDPRDPTPQRLTAEWSRLRRTGEALTGVSPPADAAPALAAVLRAWPARTDAQATDLSVDGAGAALGVALAGDPGPFLRSLAPPPGWRLGEPQINTAGGVTRLSLHLSPPPSPPPVPPSSHQHHDRGPTAAAEAGGPR